MSHLELKKGVLQVLVDNIHNNTTPHAVDSDSIARALKVERMDVIDVLKSMHEKGVIISSEENQYSIITGKGVEYINGYNHIQL
mgnify:CR=1 FL=1